MSVTYYLGAGASAKKIPCVADLSESIRKIGIFIKENSTQKDISYSINGDKYNIDVKADSQKKSSKKSFKARSEAINCF